MNSNPSRRSLKFPLIVLLIVAASVGWLYTDDVVTRAFMSILLVLLWLLTTALWWALGSEGKRLRRLGVVALGIIAVLAFFKTSVRYAGSADGSAMPQLAWKWTKTDAPVLAPLVMIPTSSESQNLGAVPEGVADSLQFMAPQGSAARPAASWSTDWKAQPPREVWRKPVGLGWSGFSVVGRRAITQEQREGDECVTCYDIATGEVLWSHADKTRFSEAMGGDGPRSTPTIDLATGSVFTQGGTGILQSLDLATGEVKWSRNILTETKTANITWGKSNSPVLSDGLVIVTGGNTKPTLLAYQQATGDLAWTAGDDGASYSTPVLMTLAGVPQIVVINQESVTGHDPATGRVLWAFAWPSVMQSPKSAQPIQASADSVIVTSSYGVKGHLLRIAKGSDGALAATSVWQSSHPRTKFSSVSILGDHAYGLDEGTLACIDLKTGERGWRDGRYGFGQHILLGDLMLMQAERGDVVLIRLKPEALDEIARLPALSSKTWNPPTLAGRWLLVRNDREMVCYELAVQK